MKRYIYITIGVIAIFVLYSCKANPPQANNQTQVTTGDSHSPIAGMYVLNEGNMGSNHCMLDYYDMESGMYLHNIFPERNPGVIKEMGDVGNDLQIYGSKLYAVVNCSGLIIVMDAATAVEQGTIAVPNCRYIVFKDGKGYISSFAGPVDMEQTKDRLGEVLEFDTATLQVLRTTTVGYQPEEMAIVGNKLYVANSGGYRPEFGYDNTVSVVDLTSFTETKRITVGMNPHRIEPFGNILCISTRGEYYGQVPSKIFLLNTQTEQLEDSIDIGASELCAKGDSLYIIGSKFNYNTGKNTITYGIYNMSTRTLVSRRIITDNTAIEMPYGLAVNPNNDDIYSSDAKNYITPGTLHCFGPDGRHKWGVTAGEIPAHFAFRRK